MTLIRFCYTCFLWVWPVLLIQAQTHNLPTMASTMSGELTPSILVDSSASEQTQALWYNLNNLAPQHILFGHQDDLAYGVNWRGTRKLNSDVYQVSGQFPAVFGWDLSKLGTRSYNIDTVDFKAMRRWIIAAYKMGGVNTISWHVDNFVTGGDAWDAGENVVATLLPGGANHRAYKAKLDQLADFFKRLRVGLLFPEQVPIVFRPFHEHTGDWFWWGQPHCSPWEYKSLWRFTVRYLRDVKQVHNLLYCYSPDIFKDKAHYLECYPGDEFVDILGLDNYHDLHPDHDPKALTRRLKMLVELADEHNKLAALTETGLEGIPESRWWTDRLLYHITADEATRRIAWVLVWRNASVVHHYGPYATHLSADNFRSFCQDPLILMADELPLLYQLKVSRRGRLKPANSKANLYETSMILLDHKLTEEDD